ncbi:hypothetical protein KR032_002098 [Drosophila birchii]|nr:hypothetical protein KR032_002098 [Drosophila birchii]
MSSKKHLGSQARRRTNRRRAVHLSEFLRGDDEPTAQVPAPQPDSQITNQSSLGTIPSTNRSSTFVTVSPVVTPNTPEKVPPPPPLLPPAPPTPVNAWQSSCENDPPQDSFMADHKAFPDLGKQVKKVKPLAIQEANNTTLDSTKARRCCPALGNFLPKEAGGKDQAVASWLSDVHSAFNNSQGTKSPSVSLSVTSQQPSPGCLTQKIAMHPETISQKPACTGISAVDAVLPLERGPSGQRTRDQHQSPSGNRSFWEESDDSALEEQTVQRTGERETGGGLLSPNRNSLFNANAEEFFPGVREQEELNPAGESTQQQLPITRLKQRLRFQRSTRTLKRRQFGHDNGLVFEDQRPAQSQLSQLHGMPAKGRDAGQIASPGCYHSAPAAQRRQQQEVTQIHQHQGNQEYPSDVDAPATPATSAEVAPTSQQNNDDASQSIFRMSCVPLTGMGTRGPSATDISANPLPSSISGASQLTHTLSSLVPVGENYTNCSREPSIISPDLLYNRPLLNMDREETQGEEEEEEDEPTSLHQQWGRQSNSNTEIETEREQPRQQHRGPIDIDADAGVVPSACKLIFRSPSSHEDEGYPQPDLNFVPANIKQLHKTVTQRYSEYAFVYALCAQLGQDCVPMDCYVYLKMVLLASIVSIEPDELRPPISLCIISTDSLMADRLMNCIGQLAPRFLGPHEYGLQPAISGGQLSSSRYTWIVASPLLLAQQGVYYAGDWTRLSKEHGEQIEKCIENGTVPVPQLQSDQALEAAVWTHWQPENSSNQTLAFAKLCP